MSQFANIQSFQCPITGEIMDDPVITVADGHCYERQAIEEWFRRGHRTSPLTGLPLSTLAVVPNISLRNAIEEHLAESAASPPTPGRDRRKEKETALKAAVDKRESRVLQAPSGASLRTTVAPLGSP
jgi:hypothetical protein